jgi:Sec-independent protein translocase protein TatA
MFGFSLAELIVVFLVILIFIKPQDLPEIAHFLGRAFFRLKKIYKDLKITFRELEKDFGIDDLKQEINRGIADEASKIKEETTIIVDMYGNEHHVKNLHEIRPDLKAEELAEEIAKSAISSIKNDNKISDKNS